MASAHSNRMTPFYADKSLTLYHGDCLDVLRELPDASVDAVVTDPPYGLGFMGKEWDSGKSFVERKPEKRNTFDHVGGNHNPSNSSDASRTRRVEAVKFGAWCELWAAECLRVLKPGGHLLAFGGTRTFHRLTCAVEDAGFEIRDSIAWLYGSGFPKSLDVSKAIDKAAGAQREVVGNTADISGRTPGRGLSAGYHGDIVSGHVRDITAPATDDARTWQGWGTALKPAMENITVARKPLAGTVAGNVLAHGTGALNVDACRIGETVETWPKSRARPLDSRDMHHNYVNGGSETVPTGTAPAGRWPANAVLDEHSSRLLDEQSGELTSGKMPAGTQKNGKAAGIYGEWKPEPTINSTPGDSGGASRFMYTAKADAGERPFIYRPTCECEDAWPSIARATADSGLADGNSLSTSTSGSSTTDAPSPRGTTSTTSTTTNSTMTSETSDSSPSSTTSASTPGASSETACGGSPARSAASSSPSLTAIGTSRLKAGQPTGGAVPATLRAWSATSVCGRCGAPARRESHATVKPLSLMRWLVRLVTPPGGLVLDPFAGSGTTGEACILEGFRCIAIEREADYLPLIVQRVNRQRDPIAYTTAAGEDLGLFALLDDLGDPA